MGAGEMNAQPNSPKTFRKVWKCVSALKFPTAYMEYSSRSDDRRREGCREPGLSHVGHNHRL
jgi:hypothetical protein